MRRRFVLGLALLLPATSFGALGGCAGSCPEETLHGRAASGFISPTASKPSDARARPGRTFTANGVKLWYDVFGEKRGPPLVVINGGPGFDHAYMLSTDVWDRLSRRRQVVVYDQRGTGRSEPYRADGSQTIDTHVADLEALRVELGAEKVDLAGHSWGGYLGMAYATRHAERVVHLVLVGSGAPRLEDTLILLHDYFPDEMDRYEASASAILDGGPPSGGKAALRDLVTAMFYSAEKKDEFLGRNEDLYLNQAMNHALEVATAGLDMWPAVRAMHLPTLVINGRYDTNVAPETAWKIHHAIPGSRLRFFERSGHFPFVEEPDLFVEVVEPFLDGK